MQQDLLNDGIDNVKILAIGKGGTYENYNSNWVNDNSIPVLIDPAPYEAWSNWGSGQRDLYFLDAEGNYVTDFNISSLNYNQILDQILDLIPNVNNPPDVSDVTYTLDEDTQITIYLSATDVDGDVLTFNIVDSPLNGTVSLSGVSAVYTPNVNFNGFDSFTFIVNDGTDVSNVATVSLVVNAVNDAPYLYNIEDTEVESSEILTIEVQAVDVDGDNLFYTVNSGFNEATVTISNNILTFTPAYGENEVSYISIIVSDGNATHAVTFSIEIYTNGCTDTDACNYNYQANVDDGSCEYYNPEVTCDCDGTLLDINGDCCSSLFMDDCGVCNGNNECLCQEPYISINNQCLHRDDIDILQTLIDNSYNSGIDLGCGGNDSYCGSPNPYMDDPESWFWKTIDGQQYNFSDGDGTVEPLELGLQVWENGRLVSLMCGAYIYCQLSGPIPHEINQLTEIEELRLEINYLSGFVPESICELGTDYTDYLAFDISGNNLCPPYPECIDSDNQFWYQNTDSCYELGDLNEDGATNVADIVGLVNAILNSQDYMIEYDVNQDGTINVADIVSLVNLILNN